MTTDKRTQEELATAGRATLAEIRLQIKHLQGREKKVMDYLAKIGAKTSPLPLGKPELTPEEYSKEFENLWTLYPGRRGIKVGKPEAFRKFKTMKNFDREALAKACWNYAKSQTARTGFARDMVRFLKADYWPLWINPTEAMMKGTQPNDKKSPSALVEEVINGK